MYEILFISFSPWALYKIPNAQPVMCVQVRKWGNKNNNKKQNTESASDWNLLLSM